MTACAVGPVEDIGESESPVLVTSVSTQRIAQLTGDYDPEGLAHVNRTGPWGAPGIDLGANTQHDGKTFIFFGDVPRVGRESGPANDADAVAFIEDMRVPPQAKLAVGRQLDQRVNAFYVGQDGALYTLWSSWNRAWEGPSRISAKGLAPPGAAITTERQGANQLDVFFVDNWGAVNVASVVGEGSWIGPVRITDPGAAPPGAPLAAAPQGSEQIDLFFIGQNGALYVTWVVGSGEWHRPAHQITRAEVAYAGAHLATAMETSDKLTVMFIGRDQAAWAASVIGGGSWTWDPERITRPWIAPPGAPVAAAKQTATQLDLLFIGHDGGVNVAWKNPGVSWHDAVTVTRPQVAPPGAAISVERQVGNNLDALYVGNDGAVQFTQATGSGPWWYDPRPVTGPNLARPGSSVAALVKNESQTDVLYVARASDTPHVSWIRDSGATWQGPARMASGHHMTPVWKDGAFAPYTMRQCTLRPFRRCTLREPLTNQTPTGAFSWDGRVYVFVVEAVGGEYRPGQWVAPFSSLTSSDRPEEAAPYDVEFVVSGTQFVNAPTGRFLQIAPQVVRNAEVRGLPSSEGDGLIMFGQGWDGQGAGVYLAWMPLVRGQRPDRASIRYYKGGPEAASSWSSSEDDAVKLFATEFGWTSLSVAREPASGKWVLMYQLSQFFGDDFNKRSQWSGRFTTDERIVVRLADSPIAIAAAPSVSVFDPLIDGFGKFMQDMRGGHPTSHNDELGRMAPGISHPAFAYGAYLLTRDLSWNPVTRTLRLVYLMSSGRPYQVQLMQSDLTVFD